MRSLRIDLVGDVMLGRAVNERLKDEGSEYIWGDTLSILRQADCRICNLESVLSDRGSRWSRAPKVYHFRSDSEHIAALQSAQINAVSLANNHAMDFDEVAMADTLKALDDAGIAHSGVGANLVAAAEPSIFRVRNQRVALISFTDNLPDSSAGPEEPGIFYVPVDVSNEKASALFELIRYTRQGVDFLIVSAHWGGNWGTTPPPEHVNFAHALIEKGADVVFGHSPHIVRGIEVHHGKPILFSAGSFINDYMIDADERNDWSFIFSLHIQDNSVKRIVLTPTVILYCQAELATGTEAQAIANRMKKLCAALGTDLSKNGNDLEIDLSRSQTEQIQTNNTCAFQECL